MVINCFYLETDLSIILSKNLKASMGWSGGEFYENVFFFFFYAILMHVCVNFHSKIANKHRQKGDAFCQMQDNTNQGRNATLASVGFASM